MMNTTTKRRAIKIAVILLAVLVFGGPTAQAAKQPIKYDPATAALFQNADLAAGRAQPYDLPPSAAPASLEEAVRTALATGALEDVYPLEAARQEMAGLSGAEISVEIVGGYQFWEFRPDEVVLASDGSDLFAVMTPALQPVMSYRSTEERWLYLVLLDHIPQSLLYADRQGDGWAFTIEGYNPDYPDLGISPAQVWVDLLGLAAFYDTGDAGSPVLIFRRTVEASEGLSAYVGPTYFFYGLRTGSAGDLVLARAERWRDLVSSEEFIGYAQWSIRHLRENGAEPPVWEHGSLLNASNLWRAFQPTPIGMEADAASNTLKAVLWAFPVYLALLALGELLGWLTEKHRRRPEVMQARAARRRYFAKLDRGVADFSLPAPAVCLLALLLAAGLVLGGCAIAEGQERTIADRARYLLTSGAPETIEIRNNRNQNHEALIRFLGLLEADPVYPHCASIRVLKPNNNANGSSVYATNTLPQVSRLIDGRLLEQFELTDGSKLAMVGTWDLNAKASETVGPRFGGRESFAYPVVGLFEGAGAYVPLAAYLREDLGTTWTTLTFDRRLTPAARSRLHRYAIDCFGERAQFQDDYTPLWQETRLALLPLGLILGLLCAGVSVCLWQKSRIRRSFLWYPVCTLLGGLGAVLLAGTVLWPLGFSHLAWGFLVPLAADTLFGVFLLRLAKG